VGFRRGGLSRVSPPAKLTGGQFGAGALDAHAVRLIPSSAWRAIGGHPKKSRMAASYRHGHM